MSLSKPDSKYRYDVSFGNALRFPIDHHYCRDWEGEDGCYGTNPEHGSSWEEAKEEYIHYLKSEIEYWRKLTEKEYLSENSLPE